MPEVEIVPEPTDPPDPTTVIQRRPVTSIPWRKQYVWDKDNNRLAHVRTKTIEAVPERYITDPDLSGVADDADLSALTIDEATKVVSELSGAELAARQEELLTPERARAMDTIDAEMDARIQSEGFEWPADSGNMFSLSLPAQIKWNGLYNLRAVLSYPVTVSLKDDSGTYDIADAAEVEAMYATAVGMVKALLDAGTGVKNAVRGASDKANIKAAVDGYRGRGR